MVNKILLWDFDGVIADSREAKLAAFKYAVSPDGPEFEIKMEALHKSAGGVSRYKKFKVYLEELNPSSVLDFETLIDRFERFLLSCWQDVPLIEGIGAVLKKVSSEVDAMYVVSAAKNAEILDFLESKNLNLYFKQIRGNELTKVEHINDLIKRYEGLTKFCLVGDSEADWGAASLTNIDFVYFSQCSEWVEANAQNFKYSASEYKSLIAELNNWLGQACIN